MSPLCLVSGHPHLKTSTETWLAGTERLPHHQHEEAVVDGIWFRNCAWCHSTIVVEVGGAQMEGASS